MPSAPAPSKAVRPLQYQLPQYREHPYSQGELDGLCGLYAAINGLRLLLAGTRPLRRSQSKQLFSTGIDLLDDSGNLGAAAKAGFCDALWAKLTAALVAQASDMGGWTICAHQPLAGQARVTRTTVFETIETAIAAGQPVLIDLSVTHQHFTVVSGYSPYSLFLFDSGPLHWLTRNNCTVAKRGDERRHHIDAASLTVLALRDQLPKPT